MSSSFFKKALIGGAVAAGAAVWAIAPRTFSDKRRNYVPAIPDVWYAHRGLHDAGSGLTAQYAAESGEYVALARRMAMKAGYGNPSVLGSIAPENSLAAFAAACEAGYGIELDLQMTADGEVVVVHDDDLMRVAGDPRRIKDLTYDELTRIPLFPTDAPGASRLHRCRALSRSLRWSPRRTMRRKATTSMCRCSPTCSRWSPAVCR